MDKSLDSVIRSLWAQKMNLTDKEILEITKAESNPSNSDPRDEIIYDGAQRFSQKYRVSFYFCCASALDLYCYEKVDDELIEKHLLKQVKKNFKDCLIPSHPSLKDFKTILLVGRTGEGKSTLVNHLTGRQDTKIAESCISETEETRLYVSDRCKLKIIDTEGLDGVNYKEKTNQELIHEIYEQTSCLLERDAKIDAIIVMWCPILNKRSGLVKTILELERVFGENALKSCIVMIQGEWENFGSPEWSLSLTRTVEEGTKELKTRFPQITAIKYDARSSVETQLPLLTEAMSKVQPYQGNSFEECRKANFLRMAQAFKIQKQQITKKGFLGRYFPSLLKH